MTQDEIRRLFEYEPQTGMLRRIVGGRKPYPWRGIGRDRRYLATEYRAEGRYKTLYLHQAVWLYHHGYIPAMIDHVNLNARDNRIENLRECTPAQNQYNVHRRGHNTSGFKGVVFHKRCPLKPWQAKIVVEGVVISLGYHATKEAAAQAYADGAKKYARRFARAEML